MIKFEPDQLARTIPDALARMGVDSAPRMTRELNVGRTTLTYYTATPSPNQWVAIATELNVAVGDHMSRLPVMLVGTGRTESAAVDALQRRLVPPSPMLIEQTAAAYVVEWAIGPAAG